MGEQQISGIGRAWEGLVGADRQQAYLQEARSGNRVAWEALVRELTPLVWHVARGNGLDREVAEDVVQTVWLAFFSQLDKLRDPKAVAAWLITTTRREARHPYGRRTRPMPLADELAGLVPSVHPAAEDAAIRADRDRRILRAYLRLPNRCQDLLRLTVLAGRAEYSPLAEAMRMPRGSVGPTRGRCLDRLRDLLAEDKEPWPGVDEDLTRQLDTVLDEADPAPAGLADRMASIMADKSMAEHAGVDEDRDSSPAPDAQPDIPSGDPAGALRSRDPEQNTTRVLDQPFFVYVAGDDHPVAQELAAAITEVLAQQGIEAVPDGSPVISSWAQRFTLRVKPILTRSEVQQRLQKVEHALEVVAVQKPMSEVNAQQADAANKLLSAAEKCDSFVALVGSMLLVKHTDESGRVNAYVQTLSVAQVRALERNQHLLKSPAELLAHLETLSCTDGAPPTTATQDVNGIVQTNSQRIAALADPGPTAHATNNDL